MVDVVYDYEKKPVKIFKRSHKGKKKRIKRRKSYRNKNKKKAIKNAIIGRNSFSNKPAARLSAGNTIPEQTVTIGGLSVPVFAVLMVLVGVVFCSIAIFVVVKVRNKNEEERNNQMSQEAINRKKEMRAANTVSWFPMPDLKDDSRSNTSWFSKSKNKPSCPHAQCVNGHCQNLTDLNSKTEVLFEAGEHTPSNASNNMQTLQNQLIPHGKAGHICTDHCKRPMSLTTQRIKNLVTILDEMNQKQPPSNYLKNENLTINDTSSSSTSHTGRKPELLAPPVGIKSTTNTNMHSRHR